MQFQIKGLIEVKYVAVVSTVRNCWDTLCNSADKCANATDGRVVALKFGLRSYGIRKYASKSAMEAGGGPGVSFLMRE